MNIGDTIQSIAAERFLPQIDKKFDRDFLNTTVENDRCLLILNGWYTTRPENWPPCEGIIPVITSFHIANFKRIKRRLLNKKSIEYFKQYEPIGCRDQKTAEMLSAKGVETFYSKCLTLTFPKREKEPQDGKVFLVDIDTNEIPVPSHIEDNAVKLSHSFPFYYSDQIKTMAARHLLEMYKQEARLVITTRLHSAIPCIAFGIPVIFFGDPKDYRLSLLYDLSVDIYRIPNEFTKYIYLTIRRIIRRIGNVSFLKSLAKTLREIALRTFINKKVDWDPGPVDVESEKRALIETTREMVQNRVNEFSKDKQYSIHQF